MIKRLIIALVIFSGLSGVVIYTAPDAEARWRMNRGFSTYRTPRPSYNTRQQFNRAAIVNNRNLQQRNIRKQQLQTRNRFKEVRTKQVAKLRLLKKTRIAMQTKLKQRQQDAFKKQTARLAKTKNTLLNKQKALKGKALAGYQKHLQQRLALKEQKKLRERKRKLEYLAKIKRQKGQGEDQAKQRARDVFTLAALTSKSFSPSKWTSPRKDFNKAAQSKQTAPPSTPQKITNVTNNRIKQSQTALSKANFTNRVQSFNKVASGKGNKKSSGDDSAGGSKSKKLAFSKAAQKLNSCDKNGCSVDKLKKSSPIPEKGIVARTTEEAAPDPRKFSRKNASPRTKKILDLVDKGKIVEVEDTKTGKVSKIQIIEGLSNRRVKVKDLGKLQRATGHEYTLLRGPRGKILIRGSLDSVAIPQKYVQQGYKWSGHSHPGSTKPSPQDKEVLAQFGQKSSVIVSSKKGVKAEQLKNENSTKTLLRQPLKTQLHAEQIARGHAFNKHVIKQGQFPFVKTKEQFARHIENVMNKPTHYKKLGGGREIFYDEKTNTIVVTNPKDPDGGTAFQDDLDYFNRQI